MDCSFFGLQLAVRSAEDPAALAELHDIITRSPEEQTLADKRVVFTRVANVLVRMTRTATHGFWDLIREPKKAQIEFDSWCGSIESTKRQELPFGGAYRGPNADWHTVATVAVLVQKGSNSDNTLGIRCDLKESEYFTRATFGMLAETLPMLNFATVAGDAIYMVPGLDGMGPTAEELRAEGYEYLKPLR